MQRRKRLATKFLVDLALWASATPMAFILRLEGDLSNQLDALVLVTAVGIPLKALVLYLMRFPWRSWYKVGLLDLKALVMGVLVGTLLVAVTSFLLAGEISIPRSVLLLEALVAIMLLSSVRVASRMFSERQRYTAAGGAEASRNVLLVGAGQAGTMIAREMLRHPEAGMRPIGFADDDPAKARSHFVGLPVLGTLDDLPGLLEKYPVDEVLISMPSEAGTVVRRVVESTREAKVAHRIIPGFFELLSGSVSISEIREVHVEDLLRREAVESNVSDVRAYVTGKTVLVTGAGGSIGSEIVRQVARHDPKRILLLGRGENSIYQIHRECRATWPGLEVTPILCDVRYYSRLAHLFAEHQPQVVFHAAAHKHVPMMEANPEEAILNNVGGTQNLAALALDHGIERFVNISTDKAVNPTSVMGASKRVAECVVQRAAGRAAPGQTFVSVRFGNVLGSRGSVVPLFKEQIKKGGPVTVTHPEMTRYFMTIPEASQLVLEAGGLAQNGSVYLLDMGESVKIVDLARDLIELSGFEPGVDIQIEFTGMRPGEKLYEELLTAEEGTTSSQHEKISVAKQPAYDPDQLDSDLDALFDAARRREHDGIVAALCAIIPVHMLPKPSRGGDGQVSPEPEVTPSQPLA